MIKRITSHLDERQAKTSEPDLGRGTQAWIAGIPRSAKVGFFIGQAIILSALGVLLGRHPSREFVWQE